MHSNQVPFALFSFVFLFLFLFFFFCQINFSSPFDMQSFNTKWFDLYVLWVCMATTLSLAPKLRPARPTHVTPTGPKKGAE
jgi:hypothetical protein